MSTKQTADTAEGIMRREVRENQTLLNKARAKLSSLLDDGNVGPTAEALAGIIDTLSKALQGASKLIAAEDSSTQEAVSVEDVMKQLKGK